MRADFLDERVPVAIWKKISPCPMTGCWLWAGFGRVGNHGGGEYGHIKVKGRSYLAHRWMYAQLAGDPPVGLVLDHLCRVTVCVNPAHLEPVTNRENTMRGVSPFAARAVATHCKHGHAFDTANTYRRTGPYGTEIRSCRPCNAAAVARRKLRIQERAA